MRQRGGGAGVMGVCVRWGVTLLVPLLTILFSFNFRPFYSLQQLSFHLNPGLTLGFHLHSMIRSCVVISPSEISMRSIRQPQELYQSFVICHYLTRPTTPRLRVPNARGAYSYAGHPKNLIPVLESLAVSPASPRVPYDLTRGLTCAS